MALIKCPECGKEISDKAQVCINCGYPLDNLSKKDRSKKLVSLSHIGYTIIRDGISFDEANKLKINQEKFGGNLVILDTNVDIAEYFKSWISTPRCPKCGSTSITTGARGVNFTMGLIGASKTVNRCSKCGYTWKPKK